ncbi:hypothetical protein YASMINEVIRUS_1036 [Yasminevirus sp. GU-2018]|uniref:Uncharacterized protein n=1 Tax=Yasminevirus sp. GU-2018 TaxID=2420051 RepID=A0A5K0UAS1_9VIRU|nr:hypothetical protein YASMINEVIRUS_1036 [Yasminevirus sp. GU-2018]
MKTKHAILLFLILGSLFMMLSYGLDGAVTTAMWRECSHDGMNSTDLYDPSNSGSRSKSIRAKKTVEQMCLYYVNQSVNYDLQSCKVQNYALPVTTAGSGTKKYVRAYANRYWCEKYDRNIMHYFSVMMYLLSVVSFSLIVLVFCLALIKVKIRHRDGSYSDFNYSPLRQGDDNV